MIAEEFLSRALFVVVSCFSFLAGGGVAGAGVGVREDWIIE